MASEVDVRTIWPGVGYHGDSMWQPELYKDPMFHEKSKYIEICYFYIRDMVHMGSITLQYVSTDEQVVDVLTNPLSWVKFEYFHDKLGVVREDFPLKEE